MTPKTLFIQKEAPGISVSVNNIISSYKFSTSIYISFIAFTLCGGHSDKINQMQTIKYLLRLSKFGTLVQLLNTSVTLSSPSIDYTYMSTI